MLPSAAQQLTRSAPASKTKDKGKKKAKNDVVARKVRESSRTRLNLSTNTAEPDTSGKDPAAMDDTGLFTPPGSNSSQDTSANLIDDADRDGSSGLISPPPEETLRLQEQSGRATSIYSPAKPSTKRKRPTTITTNRITTPHGDPASPPHSGTVLPAVTPNPKARKQRMLSHSRSPSTGHDPQPSPTETSFRPRARSQTPSHGPLNQRSGPNHTQDKPNADYVPASRSVTPSHRRSATPAHHPPNRVAYEPPSQVFSNPVEITLDAVSPAPTRRRSRSASPSKTGRAKTPAKVKEEEDPTGLAQPVPPRSAARSGRQKKELRLQIKHEPPEIDLSAPLPPATPTEDPLLLRGRTEATAIPIVDDDEIEVPHPAIQSLSPKPENIPRVASLDMHDGRNGRAGITHHMSENVQQTIPGGGDGDSMMVDSWSFDQDRRDSTQDSYRPQDDAENRHPYGEGFDVELPVSNGDGWSDSEPEPDEQPSHEPLAEASNLPGHRAPPPEDASSSFEQATLESPAPVMEYEYTGPFTDLLVPLKHDPPTEEERKRSERWGRPVSPFPLTPSEEARSRRRDSLGRTSAERDEPEGEAPKLASPKPVRPFTLIPGRHLSPRITAAPSVPVFRTERPSTPWRGRGGSAELGRNTHEDADDEQGDGTDDPFKQMGTGTPGYIPKSAQDRDKSRGSLVSVHNTEESMGDDTSAGIQPSDMRQAVESDHSVSRHGTEEEEELVVDLELSVVFDDHADDDNEAEEDSSHGPLTAPSFFSTPARRTDGEQDRGPVDPLQDGDAEGGEEMSGSGMDVEMEVDDDADMEQVVDDASDSEDDEPIVEPDVVQITSEDPKAAARAAAILRMHDYDCLPKIMVRPRRRHATVEELRKSSRRKLLSDGAVSKSKNRTPFQSRARSPLVRGGVINGRVVIPGSPAMTVPEFVQEAEEELECGSILGETPSKRPLGSAGLSTPMTWGDRLRAAKAQQARTPSPARFGVPGSRLQSPAGSDVPWMVNREPRAWSKDDWKMLDACFTDARLEAGERAGLPEGGIAEVDDVAIEEVLEIFYEVMGGKEVVMGLGHDWTEDNLRARAKALQKKQRSGNVAPPTPSMHARRSMSPWSGVEVPEYTPINRGRIAEPTVTPYSRFPVKIPAPAFTFTIPKLPLPPSLMAPRYSHLMEEAQAIANGGQPSFSDADQSGEPDPVDDSQTTEEPDAMHVDASPSDVTKEEPEEVNIGNASPSIGTRVKGFLFSYLPGSGKAKSETKASQSSKSGLPLPPAEMLEKARGPITTPAREPMPKPPPPKDLVNLHHTTPKPTLIPRMVNRPPRRLVDLRPVSPSPEAESRREVPRPRRSSGSSVKDLVQTFEHLQKLEQEKAAAALAMENSLRRRRSTPDLKQTSEQPRERPSWRP
ncbi:hypothetical protein PUNSTDRAFT_143747 [Punctularia strigosozonata HHB-11173 SS5]|uniref:uncharacterized protein n=1 Tax=Punctularia strigosozonata (strain HHB-11173) TaxID=741275 RepID=UPI0004418516|nr:uncharacterized protein PUNSTDRAFT_143747 [Punctularia strigosozonata HHB-11173 SS5]EIN09178.1 hypothetical protein PUNSTDRAFT_143747 [Punctularia strigosozonata HHB-11173 SS5]